MRKTLILFALLLAFSIFFGWLYFHQPLDSRRCKVISRKVIYLPQSAQQIAIIGCEVDDKSFLMINKVLPAGEKQLYRFIPEVSSGAGYPAPFRLEKAEPVQPNNNELFIVTSWGITGADYWGTHPIILAYKDEKFRAVNLYQEELSQDERIKGFDSTSKDIAVRNGFNRLEKIRTILARAVSVADDGQVELLFYGDNEPKAGKHKIVKIKLPLGR